jgi:hypothetical protein
MSGMKDIYNFQKDKVNRTKNRGDLEKEIWNKISFHTIFPFTRYPAPERKRIKITIAVR